MNITMHYGCFVGVFTSSIVMCKIFMVVIAFLCAHVNSTSFNRQQLTTVHLDIDDKCYIIKLESFGICLFD